MSQHDEPICSRSLEYISDRGKVDVAVHIWQPVRDPELPEDFRCRFEVTGLPEEITGNAAGVDAMQALVCALRGIQTKLQPFEEKLRFLDSPYQDWSEILIGAIDPGRRRRVLQILEEEEYSLETLFKERTGARRLRVLKTQVEQSFHGRK